MGASPDLAARSSAGFALQGRTWGWSPVLPILVCLEAQCLEDNSPVLIHPHCCLAHLAWSSLSVKMEL